MFPDEKVRPSMRVKILRRLEGNSVKTAAAGQGTTLKRESQLAAVTSN
jgi:hypothetical protein